MTLDSRPWEGRSVTEYQIQPNTRRCVVSGRELKPGERYFSVLLDEGGKFVRRTTARSVARPPADAFSFWAGRRPGRRRPSPPPIDDDMLLECFGRLEGRTGRRAENFRFVLALLLMRRKRFKFEETRNETARVLCLRCVRTGTRHEVANPRLTDEEMAAVQEDVFRPSAGNKSRRVHDELLLRAVPCGG